MQPTTNTPVPDIGQQSPEAITPPLTQSNSGAEEPVAAPLTIQPQTATTEEAQGLPAAGRFDMRSVYPTIVERQPPTVAQPAAQPLGQQPVPGAPAESAPMQQAQNAVPTQFTPYQQITSSPESWPIEKVDIPMKNICVVGLAGPMASVTLLSSMYAIVIFSMLQLFSGGGYGGFAKFVVDIFTNPWFQALIMAGLLYLNIKITATYYEDLKVPSSFKAAVFSVLPTFSIIILAYKFGIGRDSFSLFSAIGGAYLTVLFSLFSGLLWYPLSVKWGLSSIESSMKQFYPYIAGGVIVLGIGAYILTVFSSSSNLL
jgi:hypothetical protein